MWKSLLLAAGWLLLSSITVAAQKNILADCNGSPSEQGIAGCTRVITQGNLEDRLLAAAHNNRGFSLLQLQRYDEAIEDLGKAIELSPNFHTAYLNRGAALARSGKIDLAIKDFESVVKLRPNDPVSQINLGKAHFINGQYDEAIKNYNEAIRIDPNIADSFNGRADAHFKKRQFDQALKDYDEAIRLRPNFSNAMNNRKLALSAKKKAEREKTQRAKEPVTSQSAPPGNLQTVSAALRQGEMAFNKGLYERAASSFSTAIKLGPQEPAAYFGRANAYARKGDHNQAIIDYSQAIRLRPRYPVAYINRGIAYYKLTQFDRAILDFEQALGLDPGDALARECRKITMERKAEQNRPTASPSGNSPSTLRQGTSQLNESIVGRTLNN